jgi:hypothetical protein
MTRARDCNDDACGRMRGRARQTNSFAMREEQNAQRGAGEEQAALREAAGRYGQRLPRHETKRGNERRWLAGKGYLAGGCAEQDAHAALPQAGEGVLERIAANAVEHAVHAGTT